MRPTEAERFQDNLIPQQQAPKLCCTCTHYTEGDPFPLCEHPKATIPDYVHGTKHRQHSCHVMRALEHDGCGASARLFEPKENAK